MKRSLVALAVLWAAGAWADAPAKEIAALPGLLRYWTFDEGYGDEVANHAPSPAGKLALTGGPQGSLTIVHDTGWGDVSPLVRAKKKGEIEPRWIRGRLPGKSALRVGTYARGLFRAGLSGTELTNGFTLAMWTRFVSGTNRFDQAHLVKMSDAYSDGFDVYAVSYDKKNVGYHARFALGKDAAGKQLFAEVRSDGVPVGAWHFVAVTWDGKEVRMSVDGKAGKAKPMDRPFVPIKMGGGWTAYFPFFEDLIRGCFTVGGTCRSPSNVPFDMDMLAVFDRPLSESELKAVAGPAASVNEPEPEPIAKLVLPQDTAGYFRIGEKVPMRVCLRDRGLGIGDWGLGMKLKIHVETLDGQLIEDREVQIPERTTNNQQLTTLTFPRCGVYLVDAWLYDAKGNLIDRPFEPWSVGIVPQKPAHVDSPIGFWAMHENFSFDTNLRRVCFDDWGKTPERREDWVGYRSMTNRYAIYTKKQGIDPKDLRMYSFLPHVCTQGKSIPKDKIGDLRTKLEWAAQTCRELGIREFEVTSEVDGRTTPEAYVEHLKIIDEIFRKHVPDAQFFPPGATPCALPFIDKILALGATNYAMGVSHHNYVANPIHWYRWNDLRHRFAALREKYRGKGGKRLHLYNTEVMIETLPRSRFRPMTRDHARAAGYPSSNNGGEESFVTSCPALPETDSSAFQIHLDLLNLLSGFEMVVYCGCGMFGAYPSLHGVATTALSGQVLNGFASIEEIELPSLDSVCARIRRKDGSSVVALFGLRPETFAFAAPAGAAFRTMDSFGNFGSVTVPASGVLTLESGRQVQYLFGLPETFAVLAPLKLELPKEMDDNGRLAGVLKVRNPLGTALKGTLVPVERRGCRVELDRTCLALEPGAELTIPVRVTGEGLRKQAYPVRIELKGADGALVAAAETSFVSRGVITTVPRLKGAMPLDGDVTKWKDVPVRVCDTADEVVHGVPNFAEPWIPQWRNAKDLALRLRTGYVKDEALYFLLEVDDDTVFPSPDGTRTFLYDGLEFFIDTRTGAALGAAVDVGADQAMLAASRKDKAERMPVAFARPGLEHVAVECVSRRTATGYLIEGRVVPNGKCALSLRPGTQFLMDFLVDDTDEAEHLRKAAMAVHGQFNNNSNVSRWGRYELGL